MRIPALLVAQMVPLLLALPRTAGAQRVDAPRLPASCDYRACAYNIIAALHGLRVVRGTGETQVATLGFLWTRDISSAFDGEGHDAARTAVRTRRWGALFTDVGLALLATGAVSVGVSVPLQFLADKHLARAVWQHNARYAAEIR